MPGDADPREPQRRTAGAAELTVRPTDRVGLYRDAIRAIANNLHDEAEQVRALQRIGFDLGEAHRIAALAPQALARAVIEDIALVKWSATIAVGDKEFLLDRQPEYAELRRLARRHRREGFFDPASFKAITESTAEIDVVSNALNEGAEIQGSVIASCLLYEPFAEHLLP